MHNVIESIASNDKIPQIHDKHPYDSISFSYPNLKIQFIYIFYMLYLYGKNLIFRQLKMGSRWNVAFQKTTDWKSAVLRKSIIIKNPLGKFLADPFLFEDNGRHILFVESYDIIKMRGNICAYEIRDSKYVELGTVLEEPFHISFPYVFKSDGEIYMCPETQESNEIRLYKCIDFPTKWMLHKVLIKYVKAVDSIILHNDNKWWILTNIDSSDLGDRASELHIFYSDNLVSDNWMPHNLNPVIFDSLCARNGGFFIDSNKMYRVFQMQKYNQYGGGLGIAEIKLLTELEYKEQVYCNIFPNFIKRSTGTHSFSISSKYIACDFLNSSDSSNS